MNLPDGPDLDWKRIESARTLPIANQNRRIFS
jgi:hypothetical protein